MELRLTLLEGQNSGNGVPNSIVIDSFFFLVGKRSLQFRIQSSEKPEKSIKAK